MHNYNLLCDRIAARWASKFIGTLKFASGILFALLHDSTQDSLPESACHFVQAFDAIRSAWAHLNDLHPKAASACKQRTMPVVEKLSSGPYRKAIWVWFTPWTTLAEYQKP